MKLNNKGFVISTLMYALLIVFLFLIIGIITLLSNRKMILDKLKKDVKDEANGMIKYKYYPDGTAIYYNPVTNKICTDYEEDNSLNETKTGCLKWYTFNDSVNSNKVNMILDHNTTSSVAWINHDDYIEAGGSDNDWNNNIRNNKGYVTLQKELDKLVDESKWKVTPRIISADEVAHIVGADRDDTLKWKSEKEYGTDIDEQVNWFYLDGSGNSYSGWQTQVANSTSKSKYAWLYDYTRGCATDGCNVEGNDPGYWTSTPVNGYTSDSARVWNIYGAGNLRIYQYVYQEDKRGIRPVITINKKNIYAQYKEEKLNGADPVLNKDMIPVLINDNGTVRKANVSEEWYNYQDKRWANVVVLNSETDYKNGAIIPESNIKAYYVWIPRYKYKLFDNTSESTIDIIFENNKTTKSNSTTVGQYLTHPAFTYGTEELNGIWVGKFETSVDTTNACYTTENETNCNKELSNPRIKPSVSSLRYQQVVNQFKTSQKVSIGSKMMKNDEWGAVAYLSHSKYGINSKIRNNNNSGYKTGCGASTNGAASAATCDIEYGKATAYPQSTTGNISGIFDMSGGASEYTMSVLSDKNGKAFSGRHNLYNSGFNGKYGCPTCDAGTSGVDSSLLELTSGVDYPNIREYNLYYNPADTTDNRTNTKINNGCNGSPCYGYALSETTKTSSGGNNSWYNEFAYFSTYSIPWIVRGGSCTSGTGAGIFAYDYHNGRAQNKWSFRVVVR